MARRKEESEQLYRVREGFGVPDPQTGYLRAYRTGQLIDASDPLVRTHSALLEPASNKVEQATAAPGERRSLRLPGGTTVEGATLHRGGHADQSRIPTTPQEGDMVHHLPPSDPRSPASEFAPAQPGAGVVAPDVTEEQNPAGAPQTDAGGSAPEGVEVPTAGGGSSYDPSEYTVEQVNAHLDTVSEEEQSRILQAERDGKNRTGIVG
jgi:hypothetical protein